MAFQIVRNDITRVRADAIVNTANPNPVVGGGTDSAIYQAAGEKKLLAERKKIGPIARGAAVETPAFDLPAKYIIHTVGPVWEGGKKGEFDILKACYENSLELARKLRCRSIAFPLIATGVYGFPKDKALQIAMSVIQPFLMAHSMKVILVVFDKKAFELSGAVVENIREYVDTNYVEEARKREYQSDDYRREKDPEASHRRRLRQEYERNNYVRFAEIRTPSPEELEEAEEPKRSKRGRVSIDELIASSDKTFQEKLFEIIDQRGLTGPQVYKNYISKQVYSKIQADKDYHPNKFTAIALCLSLHLNIDETKDLIGRAGWTLSPSSKADLVVTGCIMNGEYNLVQINMMLFYYECPLLERIK